MSTIQIDDQRVPIPPAPRLDQDDNWGKQRLLKTDEAKRAAAMAVGNLVADFAANPQTPQQAEVAGKILGELTESLGLVERQAARVAAPAPSTPTIDYTLPEEVAELLDDDTTVEFDDEDDTPEPVAAEDPEVADDDPETLKRKLAAAEKKAEHERKLRVQTARGSWEAEARKVFNKNVELLTDDEIAGIQADSKRSFFAQAKEVADRNKALAARFGGGQPILERREPVQDPEVWGDPTVGDPLAPAGSIRQADRLQAARRTGRLSNSIKAMIYPDS